MSPNTDSTKPSGFSTTALFATSGLLMGGGFIAGVWAEISHTFDPLLGIVPAACGLFLGLFTALRAGATKAVQAPAATESNLGKRLKRDFLAGRALSLRMNGRVTEAGEMEDRADDLTAELYPKERARIEARRDMRRVRVVSPSKSHLADDGRQNTR